ncbi:MAG: carbohydrate-binding domain-containing protein [Coriobacteriia bacterium]|nr:carbohydrate-binding domain-containing protein [Coriobacteriia bacterium]
MKRNLLSKWGSVAVSVALMGLLAGCSAPAETTASAAESSSTAVVTQASDTAASESSAETAEATVEEAEAYTVESGLFKGEKMFTGRDLTQTADTSGATQLTLTSGEDLTISEEGVYVVSGTATDSTIIVDAEDSAKVQIVLDGVNVTNETAPAIYVKSADKVFVTLQGENTLATTGAFEADGDTNVDAVIFSKDDLVLNGSGSLTVNSSANAIASKDDLKVTGGTYTITCTGHGFEANDALAVYDGAFTIDAGKDGFHGSNDDDPTLGYIYVCGGTFNVTAQSDALHADSAAQIDGGTFTLNAPECIEGTYVQVNGGDIDISASDDGINAPAKSTAYTSTIEITGGDLKIEMGSGDTDALDSNGNLYISGGTVDITAQFAFDYDGEATLTGGTVTVNGEQVTEIANSMMMGGDMGGHGGMGGGPQGGMRS